jgi:hypothetical protein
MNLRRKRLTREIKQFILARTAHMNNNSVVFMAAPISGTKIIAGG